MTVSAITARITRASIAALSLLLLNSGAWAQWAPTRPATDINDIGGVMDEAATAASPAPSATTAPATNGQALSEITVTGTRIIRNGYEAPTPVTVIGIDQIQDQAAPNYADALNQMPIFQGSVSETSSGASDSGSAGQNQLSLRNLGPARVLVLFDGRRFPPDNQQAANEVNVNLFPDALVQRIDVVTGGASSVYGSDAVSGVVNYVLNTNFNGVQGLVQGGMTSRGDGGNDKIQLTLGTPFMDGRGHIEVSGDQEWQDLIYGFDRDWNMTGLQLVPNLAYKAGSRLPQYTTQTQVGLSAGYPGGIISGGPLKGTAFGLDGAPQQYNYGTLDGTYNIGGDWASSSQAGGTDIEAGSNAVHFFSDVRFDVTDNVQMYAQFNGAYDHTKDRCCYNYYLGNLTLSAYNPYLPSSVATQLLNDGQTSLPFGLTIRGATLDPSCYLQLCGLQQGFGSMDNRWSDVEVLGAKGKFTAFKSSWTWNVYGQNGTATNSVWAAPYQANTQNFMDAIQAVRVGTYGGNASYATVSPAGVATTTAAYNAANFPNPLGLAAGTITCASNLLPVGAAGATKNCVPYNVFGLGVQSQAAQQYVLGGAFERYTIGQKLLGGSITGEPFNSWAGPVSVAADAEYRVDAIWGYNDPISNYIGWFSSQENAYDASEYVYEGALETVVPLLKGLPGVQELDFNGALRATEYSVSGYATTWKLGLEYAPVTDLRIRMTESEDIRAPNLTDLYTAPKTTHNTVPDPAFNNVSYPVYETSLGNPKLVPESAHETGIGVVFQPVEIPGFGLSVDYYDIDLKNAIESLPFNYVLDNCYAGITSYCSDILRNANGTLQQISVGPANLAEIVVKGLDYELDYNRPLTQWVVSWKGNLGFRLVATETLDDITTTGIPGPTEVLQGAGVASVPRWGVYGTLSYELDKWRLAWSSRYDSAVQQSNTQIACSTNCPTAVPAGFVTVDRNHVGSYIVSYLSVNYRFHEQGSSTAEAFVAVDNVLNRTPPPVAALAGPTYGLTTNPTLYDTIGLAFRAGVRFKL